MPSAVPLPPSMSDAAKETAYQVYRDSRWEAVVSEYPDVERPDADFVRFVAPGEMPATIVQCLDAAGFAAQDTSDGFGPALETSSVQGQESALAVAWYVCDIEYPIDPELTQPYSDEELDYLYDYDTIVLVPCLEALGYDISEPPSRQAFKEASGQGGAWIPYADLMSLSQAELLEANAQCPQNPPGMRD